MPLPARRIGAMLGSNLSIALVTEAWEMVPADAGIAFHIVPML